MEPTEKFLAYVKLMNEIKKAKEECEEKMDLAFNNCNSSVNAK